MIEWLEPWYSIADNPELAAGMEGELYRELANGHPLYGLTMRAVGRRQDCDDVLFAIEDGTGRFAVVHLTWLRSPPDRPPWPHSAVFLSFEDWVTACMVPEHRDFLNEVPESDF